MSPSPAAYESWTREDLIARLVRLDSHPPSRHTKRHQQHQQPNSFDFSAHPRRKIALKFSYNGSQYAGLEFQKDMTVLPTVEGVLFEALSHTRLIDPAAGFEDCGWEKCGRTDKGVSAAGQVVSFWVRSALGDVQKPEEELLITETDVERDGKQNEAQPTEDVDEGPGLEGDFALMADWDEPPTNSSRPPPAKPTREFSYISSLNNVLPPTIRVIAWSPVTPDFSARFSCRYRHYKYFFNPQGLDLAAMQDAASRLVGEHDFRNICKVDASKQLTIFTRRILSADINPADNGVYVLDLIGNAFLYNQVRHIMAVLFLVGTGLERPSVIDALLNVDPEAPRGSSRESEGTPPVVRGKPEYQMADPLPLMLWECGYDADAVSWRTDEDHEANAVLSQRDISNNLYQGMQSLHEKSLIHTVLDTHFLRATAKHHRPPPQYFPVGHPDVQLVPKGSILSIPLGAGTFRRGAKYVPLVERPRGDLVEVINERWRKGKGARQMEREALAAKVDEEE
ncbi:tRNA pseudouridine synthase [Laetiporus sulphureus 93-53]|uniref:tRNA pseudouridine synthase n=1 Tax=Laetiporus sulphureus 93-53 TaxID=1314785 RepID=A0A165DP31_9APHY|nr:tRNA pseudouridine synthase [Laetiporus sulphureus 93-53]KZT05310.1 tRNA pseudouridine synthase [Laetiporus sulphureus 93-53]